MISPVRFGGRPAKSFSSLPRAPLCALVLTLLAGACRTAAPSATASAAAARPDAQAYLVEVERRAASESSAPSLGRAALATYLVTGQPDRAAPWITKALAADAHEPQALYTKVLIAREALDDRANVEASLAILQYAPTSPLAELAAFRLRELAGQSPALDALMLDGLKGLNTGSMGLEGHAALRAREALATILDAHNDDAGSAAIRSQLGMPTAWTVVGPLSAYRLRDFPNASPFDDPRHVLTATYPSVVGPVAPRDFVTPDGALDLESESWRADLFEAVADLSVKTGGEYLVALRGANAATLYLDGVIMARRVPVPNRPPERA